MSAFFGQRPRQSLVGPVFQDRKSEALVKGRVPRHIAERRESDRYQIPGLGSVEGGSYQLATNAPALMINGYREFPNVQISTNYLG